MKITVTDREGYKYLLTERHLQEVCRRQQRRIVREDLARALNVAAEDAHIATVPGELVDGWWLKRLVHRGYNWDVRLHDSDMPSLCEIRIGCKVFLGYDASEILAWARGRKSEPG